MKREETGVAKQQDDKTRAKERRVESLTIVKPTIKFKGQHMIRVAGEWQTLTRDLFDTVFYDTFGGMTITTINETFNMVKATAPNRDDLADYIALGDGRVWDMAKADFTTEVANEDCVFATAYSPNSAHTAAVEQFLLEVANGDRSVRDDILQSLAPLLVSKKPAGVIWWQGKGRNGKTATMDLLYKLFPNHLSGVTLKQLEDERDTLALNGKLGNIVRESSETVIEDSRTYKAVGTHEDFWVHKFHSQDQVKIDGSLHHVFSTNNMPIFSDKSDGARRRTLIVQFKNQFKDDPTFQERVFTREFLEGFLHLLLKAAAKLRDNNFQYDWSPATQTVKSDYDKVVNTAETFAKWMVEEVNVVFFSNFAQLRNAYNWWCDNNSYTALGKSHLRYAVVEAGFVRSSRRKDDGRTQEIFKLKEASTEGTHEILPGVYARNPLGDTQPEPVKGAESLELW